MPLMACPYTQVRHSGMDYRNPGYRDVLSSPSMVLDTPFPAGMTIFGYNGMPWKRHATTDHATTKYWPNLFFAHFRGHSLMIVLIF
ncbi:MAG: hypothetical protein ACU83V_14035 [Gammaproteobacteria bacterium]